MAQHPKATARYEAVIFDMDGVVTDTAVVHAGAWKRLFDEVLPLLAPDAAPFDEVADYRRSVDGRPREDGVRSFLASRGVMLPDGTGRRARGTAKTPTVQSLAARKQYFFDRELRENGVSAYPDAVTLLHRLRAQGIPTAVVTSSRNCRQVLQAAGVGDLFDVIVDGTDAERMHLPGKPDPATFLEAARQLHVTAAKAIVLEDAEAGVAAASNGAFGWVVGVSRHGADELLRAAGAHLIVTDLSDLDTRLAATHPGWAGGESESDPWRLRYVGFDPATEPQREALCTLGNGYWATRGAAPEVAATFPHYPGTYLAGVYNRLRTHVDDHSTEDESLVNAPNWLPLTFRTGGIHTGEERRDDKHGDDELWFDLDGAELLDYEQTLDLGRAVLTRAFRTRDAAGRITRITQQRFVSQHDDHVAGLTVTFEAENWSGPLTLRSALDGRVANRNVPEYRLLADKHLVPRASAEVDADTVLLEMETSQSGIHIVMAARTRVLVDGAVRQPPRTLRTDAEGWIAHEISLELVEGHPLTVQKTVVVCTSRDRAISSPTLAVTKRMRLLPDHEALLSAHEAAWRVLWNEFTVLLETDSQQPDDRQQLALNINTFHVLQSVAGVTADLDAGLPARGLHGEGYRGHVFWDELFVYPTLSMHRPEISRALLGYRYRRLGEARAAARVAGHQGAMFPWQSGIDGREETPTELFNLRNDAWMPDNSHLQRHVGLAIAYSAWKFYESTGEISYLVEQGAELIIEIARFFASVATHDEAADRYDIAGVMGPDEFHDGYPGVPGTGLRNNAYTNVMAAWVMQRAADVVELLKPRYADQVWNRVKLHPGESDGWRRIGRRLRIPFHADGVISQFEGYEQLKEFDWAGYRARYGAIGRLDLILAAEGDSTNNYKVCKQADVLMLLYLFSADELRQVLQGLGYDFAPEAIPRTVEYYRDRSSHGSTLSNVVHSWVEARGNRARSWDFLVQALESDLADIQGGTTHTGVHLGAMAGSIDMVTRCYTGLELQGGVLSLNPVLPPEIEQIDFTLYFQQQLIRVTVDSVMLRLFVYQGGSASIAAMVGGMAVQLRPGETREFAFGDS
ncbi:beta-phosphoglucomutase family hydrolase [Leifsonia sp. YAF41]|uniref:beta-phosphoglucomutase family hydrolase n=1 Tax=Leifsonia sp. YAF41 TaxID=3233086 RepID=UPI003F9850C6